MNNTPDYYCPDCLVYWQSAGLYCWVCGKPGEPLSDDEITSLAISEFPL